MASGGSAIEVDEYETDGNEGPKHFALAVADIGTMEWVMEGRKKVPNPRVVGWIKEVTGAPANSMTVPWCAYYVGHCLKGGGLPHTGSGMARSYLKWGQEIKLKDARRGDVVVTWRGKIDDGVTGHVFFFDRLAADGRIIGVGGNQGDSVSRQAFGTEKLLSIRRYRSPAKSRTIRGIVGSGGTEAVKEVADQLIPEAPKAAKVVQALEEAKGPIEQLATYKPWLLGILSVISIGLLLWALYARWDDHNKGQNS